jgi:hypothetical protein
LTAIGKVLRTNEEKWSKHQKQNKAKKVAAIRVARWFIFNPKIPTWVNFGGAQIGKC